MMIQNLLAEMPEYSQFKFWFLPAAAISRVWAVYLKGETVADNVFVGELRESEELLVTLVHSEEAEASLSTLAEDAEEVIKQDFNMYKSRCEYLLSCPVSVDADGVDQESLIAEYEKRIIGVTFVRAYRNDLSPDESAMRPGQKCIEWLESTDFFSAPGSTQYHDSEPAGLLKHSLRVFNHIIKLKYYPAFLSVLLDECVYIALCHDWCKIGLYELYMRNVKNENTGKWEQVPAYRYNQKGIPLGHGVSSMFLAEKFFRLTPEEAAAIRWHMGSWNVAPNEMNELQLSNEKYPLAHLIQFADCLSITEYAN